MPNNVYSLNDRIQIIQLFYSSGGSYRSVTKKFNETNSRGPKMSCNTVIRMVQRFESTGCLNKEHDIIKQPSRAIPEECRVEICEIARREPARSLRKISFDVGLSVSTVRRVLKEDNLSDYYKRLGTRKSAEELQQELQQMKTKNAQNETDEEEDEDSEEGGFSDGEDSEAMIINTEEESEEEESKKTSKKTKKVKP